jgi:hypothetical protein
MRHRGAKFWLWSNTRLPLHTYEEVLSNGVQVEVQARINHAGVSQVFIGLYTESGWVICEESHDRSTAEYYCTALKWGDSTGEGTSRGHSSVCRTAPGTVNVRGCDRR